MKRYRFYAVNSIDSKQEKAGITIEDWVKHSDVEHLVKENERLKVELKKDKLSVSID